MIRNTVHRIFWESTHNTVFAQIVVESVRQSIQNKEAKAHTKMSLQAYLREPNIYVLDNKRCILKKYFVCVGVQEGTIFAAIAFVVAAVAGSRHNRRMHEIAVECWVAPFECFCYFFCTVWVLHAMCCVRLVNEVAEALITSNWKEPIHLSVEDDISQCLNILRSGVSFHCSFEWICSSNARFV